VVSFLLAFPPISYMHSSSPTFVLHALSIEIIFLTFSHRTHGTPLFSTLRANPLRSRIMWTVYNATHHSRVIAFHLWNLFPNCFTLALTGFWNATYMEAAIRNNIYTFTFKSPQSWHMDYSRINEVHLRTAHAINHLKNTDYFIHNLL
jgi:hypothetical protein